MNSRILLFFIGTIFLFPSCQHENIEYSYTKTLTLIDFDKKITLGDTINLKLGYNIEDPNFSFHQLICEEWDLNSNYVKEFLFKIELINTPNQSQNETDTIVWQYLPTETGAYKIELFTTDFPYDTYSIEVEYPTYSYTFEQKDYQMILDSVLNNPDLKEYVDAYGTSEYYFGASAYYLNFDLRISARIRSGQTEFTTLSETEAMNLIWERLISSLPIVLKTNFPNASENEILVLLFKIYGNDLSKNTYAARFFTQKIDNKIIYEFLDVNVN